ncbi:MAG: hypothetical protein IH623_19255 [Verrucomicrobia bacterium]|nr:hypothetical protein [Verrucomicrobiota bacterium]
MHMITRLRFCHVLVGLLLLSNLYRQDSSAQYAKHFHVPTMLAQLQPVESGAPATGGQENQDTGAESTSEPLRERLPEKIKTSGRWSFAFGVGIISDTRVHDYFTVNYKELNGPGSGLTYNLTASYRLREFDWKLWNSRVQPQLELPFMLTLVDEDGKDMFPDYNLGLTFRWRDFPWNHFVYTTFAIGGGLSYSSKIWTADRQRHEGEDRSNLKYWLPLEFTLALPRYPQHQLMLFIDHQSGGWMFDTGGVDVWGAGYRIQF